MRFLDRFQQGELRLSRVAAFSDGVFAIVVTVLVLELKVPTLQEHSSAGELAHRLVDLLPKFLSWLISFVIVCKFWLNHHHLLEFARHANYAMVWLNSIFLLFQSFIPFPTALLGEYPDDPVAISLFGMVMAVNTLAFIALHRYILRPAEAGTGWDDRSPLAGEVARRDGILLARLGSRLAPCVPGVRLVLHHAAFFITPLRPHKPAGEQGRPLEDGARGSHR